MTKRCQTCKTDKELADFNKDRSREDGYATRCRACQAAAHKVSTYNRKRQRIKAANPPLVVDIVETKGLNQADKAMARRALIALAQRRMEALRLYEPMPAQQAFHDSMASERIFWGANRAGKTLATCAELARAFTGQDPMDRYPKTGAIWYVVGKDQKQLAEVVWPKLGRPGAFKIIRDLETKEWRTYRPYDPIDLARKKDARPAPPLIPRRFIADIAWEDKKMDLPKTVIGINGNKLHFFSGNSKPTQGSAIDGCLFDEEIPDGNWYSEIAARLVDKDGYFIWGATPQEGTDQLLELHDRALAEMTNPETMGEPRIEEFHVRLWDNKFTTKQQKLNFIAKLTDEEKRVRVDGEFAVLGSVIYPEYRETVHVVEYFDIPSHWTRYAAIDPGHQICAVLFMAIPPPTDEKHGMYAYLYDELYIPDCDASIFGERMSGKALSQQFQAFIIDTQEARKTETGSGKTIEEQYSAALAVRNVASVDTGNGFAKGSTDRRADVGVIRMWVRPRGDNVGPRLRVMASVCPNFHKEFARWRWKKVSGAVTDTPEDRGPVHLCAGLRYLVQYNPVWVQPTRGPSRESAAVSYMRKKNENQTRKPMVILGPCGAGA